MLLESKYIIYCNNIYQRFSTALHSRAHQPVDRIGSSITLHDAHINLFRLIVDIRVRTKRSISVGVKKDTIGYSLGIFVPYRRNDSRSKNIVDRLPN